MAPPSNNVLWGSIASGLNSTVTSAECYLCFLRLDSLLDPLVTFCSALGSGRWNTEKVPMVSFWEDPCLSNLEPISSSCPGLGRLLGKVLIQISWELDFLKQMSVGKYSPSRQGALFLPLLISQAPWGKESSTGQIFSQVSSTGLRKDMFRIGFVLWTIAGIR